MFTKHFRPRKTPDTSPKKRSDIFTLIDGWQQKLDMGSHKYDGPPLWKVAPSKAKPAADRFPVDLFQSIMGIVEPVTDGPTPVRSIIPPPYADALKVGLRMPQHMYEECRVVQGGGAPRPELQEPSDDSVLYYWSDERIKEMLIPMYLHAEKANWKGQGCTKGAV